MRPRIMILTLILTACMPAAIAYMPGGNSGPAGDTQAKINTIKNTKKDFQMSPQHGIIIARVINASPYTQPFNYLTLSPKDVFEKKENQFTRIEAIKKLAGKTTVFASPLPAGDYSLADLYSYHTYYSYDGSYSYYYQLLANADPKFGTFKVESGKITNLGTIIYYQKPDGDKYIELLTRKDEFNEGLEYLENEKPELHKQLDAATMLSWNKDDYAAERQDLYLNIAQNPIAFDKVYPQEDGSWYFTSKLGVLLQRSAQGKWDIEAMDTDYNLTQFCRNAAGDMATVDERGSIFLKLRNAKNWTAIPQPVPGAEIGFVHLSDTADIHAISLLQTEFQVHSGKISNNPGWILRMNFQPNLGWGTPDKPADTLKKFTDTKKNRTIKAKKIKDFSATVFQGKILVLVNGKTYDLKPELGQATRISPDHDLVSAEQSYAYHQFSIPGYLSHDDDKYSLDAGASWHTFEHVQDNCPGSKIKMSCDNDKYRFRNIQHMGTPIFFTDGTAYSIVWQKRGTDPRYGPESDTKFFLVTSRNRGSTWAAPPGPELPKYCTDLRKGPGEKTLLLSCKTTGQFYKADRETLKWEIDYQPALF